MAEKTLEVSDGFIIFREPKKIIMPRHVKLDVSDAFMISPEIKIGGEQKPIDKGDE